MFFPDTPVGAMAPRETIRLLNTTASLFQVGIVIYNEFFEIPTPFGVEGLTDGLLIIDLEPGVP